MKRHSRAAVATIAARLFTCLAVARAQAGDLPDTSAGEIEKSEGTTVPPDARSPIKPHVASRKIEGWGTATDAAGDCRFLLKDETLTLTVPGTEKEHMLEEHPLCLPAPRVLTPLSGDFNLTVKVHGSCTPESDFGQEYFGAWGAAGLVVMADPKNFVTLTRSAHECECSTEDQFGKRVWREWSVCATLNVCANGKRQALLLSEDSFFGESEAVWLRLTRTGNLLKSAVSGDGIYWTAGPVRALIEPVWQKDNLSTGVVATSGAATVFSPVFSGFSAGKPDAGVGPNPPAKRGDGATKTAKSRQ